MKCAGRAGSDAVIKYRANLFMKPIRITMQYGNTVVEIVMRVVSTDVHSLRQVRNLLESNGRVTQIKCGRKVVKL